MELTGKTATLKKNLLGKGRNTGKIIEAHGVGPDAYIKVERDDGTFFECVRRELTVKRDA